MRESTVVCILGAAIIVATIIGFAMIYNANHNWQQYDFQLQKACIDQGGLWQTDKGGTNGCYWSKK